MQEQSFRSTFLVEAAPERLWPLVSDTERLNRALGFPPVQYEARAGTDPAPLQARSTYLGMAVEWEEHPFEWVYGRCYAVERIFRSGPIERVYGGVNLRAVGADRTEVEVFADVRPRNPAGWLAAKMIVGPKATRGWADACRTFTRYLAGATPDAYPREEPAPRVDLPLLDERLARVARAAIAPALVARLRELILTGHDEDVLRVRPFEAAQRWSLPRLDVLRAFLHAASAGVFDLEWEVLCPNCRVAKVEQQALERLTPDAHCDFCNIRFDLQFDLNVELRFSVNRNLRAAEQGIFCIGGPGNTPHILSQTRIRAGEKREISVPLAQGKYRLRVPRLGEPVALDVEEGAAGSVVGLELTGNGPADLNRTARPGDVRMRIENRLDREVLLMVEDRRWHSLGASAALVTSLQEFRDLFSSEVLAPGLALSVRNMAILFTDLKGSTSMYEMMGDGPAFGLVRKHFDLLMRTIREHQGTLVKTIGDAVMAAFHSDVDCVRAALEIQRAVALFNAEYPRTQITVKVGAHAGPCVAVNANGTLDYFGTTVNLAARIQNESRGRDVVLSHSLASEPSVREVVAQDAIELESVEKEIRGLTELVKIVRLWPAERGTR